jgi:hypothetical protein
VKFFADPSGAGPVILALRQAGHDVLVIAEVEKRAVDERVIERALSESRVVITEDHDFGELVYARSRRSVGVIFVKFQSRAPRQACGCGGGGGEAGRTRCRMPSW